MAGERLSDPDAARIARLLRALADPARLRIMSLILARDGDEACVCDVTDGLELSQPTISHHLKVLHDSGLLDRDKRGVWVYYRVRRDALAAISAFLHPATASPERTPDTETASW